MAQTKSIDKLGDYAIVSIPKGKRRSLVSQIVVTSGFTLCMACMFCGGTLGQGLNFIDGLTALLIGTAIMSTYASFQGSAGARHGVSTTMLARHCFGRYGAYGIGAFWVFVLMGWYAYETAILAITVKEMYPPMPLGYPELCAICGILMMVTAIYGYSGVSTLSMFAVPCLVIVSLFGFISAIFVSGGIGNLTAIQPLEHYTLAQGITITVGVFACGATIQPDIARYAKSTKDAIIGVWFGMFFALSFIALAGLAMVLVTQTPGVMGTPNLPKAMMALGLGVGALFVAVIGQWTTNDNNLYTASLGLSNIITIPKKIQVVIMGVISTIVAIIGVYQYWVTWLEWLGTFIPPIAGTMIADYWIFRKYIFREPYKFGPGTKYYKLNLPAWIAVILGGIIGGIILKNVGIVALNTLLLGFIIYLLLATICYKAGIKYRFGEYTESNIGF